MFKMHDNLVEVLEQLYVRMKSDHRLPPDVELAVVIPPEFKDAFSEASPGGHITLDGDELEIVVMVDTRMKPTRLDNGEIIADIYICTPEDPEEPT